MTPRRAYSLVLIGFPRFLTGACLLLLAGLALAQTRELGGKGELLDRISVIVNDGVVLQSQIDEQVNAVSARLRHQGQLPPASVVRQQITERLILQEIQLQRAQHLGIKITDEALNAALKNVAEQNKIEFAQLPDALASEGIVYAEYREEMRREMTLSMLKNRDVFQRMYISPREIDQFLARQANGVQDTAEYNVSHILLSLPEAAPPGQLEEVEAKANDIYERAKKGEDFGQLAVTHSQAQSALERGQIGWRKGSELPTFMSDVVAKLKPGEVAPPVRTPSGFHIVRLNEMRAGNQALTVDQVHARHILIKTNELQDDETVRGRLQTIRDRITKGSEDFGAIAKAVSEDPGSGSDGGDLGWTGGGTFVPEFEKQLNELKVDEISPPFRTQYGWHLVQVLGRRTQDVSSDDKRKRAYEQIRAAKSDEETELWLRRLRDEAYVDYRM
jgi:peptidyl-prolyl cis-trans isomerase SurA